MSAEVFFLAMEAGAWRVARVRPDGTAEIREPDAAAAETPEASDLALGQHLTELGYAGQPACLGLPSDMVLSARIDTTNLPRQKHSAMIYRLEEQLPLDAESLTASFAPPVGGRALGMAVETARVQALIDRLARLGVEVVSICPTALLAFWGAGEGERDVPDYTIVAWPNAVDVFRAVDGRLVGWYSASADPSEVLRCIDADLLDQPIEGRKATVRLLGQLPGDAVRQIEGLGATALEAVAEEAPFTTAAHAAPHAVAGRTPLWMDFRRDQLALPDILKRVGRPLAAAVVLFLLLSALLAGLFIYRGMRYGEIVRDRERRQEVIFRGLCPGQDAPPNVKSRLKSDLTRLAGISGTGLEMPQRPSALDSLRQVAGNLPAQVRLRIVELRVEPDAVFVEGQAQTHGDAEIISRGMARTGFEMASPRSENLATGGVSFILMGKPAGKKDAAKPARTVEVKK